MTESCDIIEDTYSFGDFWKRPLPVSITVSRACPDTYEERERNEKEVLDAAYEQLSCELESISHLVMLLRKQTVVEWTESGVRLSCTLQCIENIAKQVDIEIKKQE